MSPRSREYRTWGETSEKEKGEILKRFMDGEDVNDLADEFNIRPQTLARRLREVNSDRGFQGHEISSIVLEAPVRVVVFSDLHIPEHDPLAVGALLQICSMYAPDMVINLGDTFDAYKFSKYEKRPKEGSDIQEDVDTWLAFMDDLQEASQGARQIVVVGNHDLRIRRKLDEAGFDDMTLEEVMRIRRIGAEGLYDAIAFNPDESGFDNATMYMTHGIFARKWAGSSVRGLMELLGGATCVVGHVHRSAKVVRRTYRGMAVGYEVGCLARLQPRYTMWADWSQSVLVGTIGPGWHNLDHIIIERGKFVWEGRVRTSKSWQT